MPSYRPHRLIVHHLVDITRILRVAAVALALAWGGAALAQHDHHDHEETATDASELGSVDFRVDCRETSVEVFDRALALMHHMMYVQARDAFSDLKAEDPDCAMAYWGVATTLFQPLWGTRPDSDELQRGRENIRLAGERVDSERERVLVDATAAFFTDDPDAGFWDRLNGWVDGMETAFEAYPDDLDIASLQGLALLTRAQEADDHHALHDRAEKILREVWEREREHPGAIHYSIHATDADGRAENALDMVEMYAQIAPDTAHALHMPSHIYVRLGDWPEVIDWNQRSADAALGHPADGAISHHYIHAIDYIVYAWLQQGRDEAAEALYREALEKGDHQPSFVSAYHLAALPARLAVENRDWRDAAAVEARKPEHLPWDEAHWPEGIAWFSQGLAAVHRDDPEAARKARDRLAELADGARDAGESRMATYIDVDRRILEAWMAQAEGNTEDALEHANAAVELESSVEKHPVTPGALMPPGEALGDLLAEQGRYDDALEAYRDSDGFWPARYNTVLGMARAADRAGHPDQAREAYQRLLEFAGESDRASLQEARDFLEDAG